MVLSIERFKDLIDKLFSRGDFNADFESFETCSSKNKKIKIKEK